MTLTQEQLDTYKNIASDLSAAADRLNAFLADCKPTVPHRQLFTPMSACGVLRGIVREMRSEIKIVKVKNK